MSQLPLEGIRVTDATASWAGPYLTNMMGTLGAEIIKVDSLQRLDIWRPSATQLLSPRDKTWEWSPNWNAVNTDKLCITLNLTDPRGVDVFKRLASISDVVTENYTPRVMPNFGLDYPVLREPESRPGDDLPSGSRNYRTLEERPRLRGPERADVRDSRADGVSR